MEKNSGTRSGLLWEVERLLNECTELPQILLMENVPQVHGSKNKVHFDKWIEFLESKGYKNYWQDLNAKNYGIPQNRNRCFMVSVLDHREFEFPKPFELKLRLKDMLEDEVDEKYYLSQKMVEYITTDNENLTETDKLILDGNLKGGKWDKINESCRRVYNPSGLSPTLHTCQGGNTEPKICIKEDTKKGYTEATEGDGVYINRPHQKRGCVQKDMIQTIKTSPNDVGVVVKDTRNMKERLCDELLEKGLVKENDVIRHSYTTSRMKGEMKDIQENNISPTLDTRCDCLGVVVKSKNGIEIPLYKDTKHLRETIEQNNLYEGQPLNLDLYNRSAREHSQTLTDPKHNTQRLWDGLRIRKLTPKECWRLMGFSDTDFDKAAQFISNAQLYKQAGNSIVVDVLQNIFRELFLKEQDISSWLDKLLEVS